MKVTIYDITKTIEKIEKKIFSNNSSFLEEWYNIRFKVYMQITYELGLYGLAHSRKQQKKNNIFKLIKKSILWFKNNPILYIFKKDVYLFFGSSRRKLQNDNTYWDIYTDHIINNIFNKNSITIEKLFEGSHYKPTPTKHLVYLEKLNVFKRFLNKNISVPDKLLKCLSDIENEINKEFDLNLSISKLGIKYYKDLLIKEKIIRFYLNYLKPKTVFIVCSYGKEYFVRAAKSLNIPVIELQHGVLNRYHMGYSFNKDLPKESFPDYFFSFGDYWNNAADFPIRSERIFSIGYPYFEEKYSKYKNYKKNNKIIFISQGTIGKHLSKFAVDFSDINKDSLEIVYKLHPGEVSRWKTEYPWLCEAEEKRKLTVLSEQKPDLYEIFAESVIQVGVNSTAIFEGYKFNCKTYIVDLPGIEYMGDFLNAGYGKIINNPEEITLNEKIVNYDSEKLFKNNWKENFITAMQKIENR